MTAFDDVKKAIDFYAEYFEREVLGDLARNAIPALESLQRENEELRKGMQTNAKRLRDANAAFERERKFHLENQDLNRNLEARAEASEAEVKRLRVIIKRNWMGKYWRGVTERNAEEVNAALASTGGEHHAE